jgi:SAM-dependent methyltransferase
MFLGDTLKLPLKSDLFDVAFSQGLIEHFKNPLSVVSEHKRILKPGGILIINVPQKYTGYTLMKKNNMKKKKWELGWETEFSYKDLKIIAENLKLKEIEVLGYQYWKSWKEPSFVLRDLIDKVYRRVPMNAFKLLKDLQLQYDTFWDKLENKWGHYFLKNIVIVVQKSK